MNATQLLTQIQSIFSLSPEDMVRICGLGGATLTDEHFSIQNDSDWCSEQQAIQFLNGFIIECRGPGENGSPPLEDNLTNNLIFRKIKIALGLQADDVLQMLADVDVVLSKHELSALFRKAGNKHHRVCSDELLKAFLGSVQVNHYG